MRAAELQVVIDGLAAGLYLREDSPGDLAFRHALTREAVYASMLLSQRKTLHRAVAATLEDVYGDALDSHVADLARHHFAAGDWEKALVYSERAGEQARSLYAPREAIDHLSRALEAAQQLARTASLCKLRRARGQAYETVGDFDRARADQESALQAARASGDQHDEWQALIDLGFLWASRDYDRTGEYFQQALELARGMDDRAALGHSLNRVGNWCTNLERVEEGTRAHEEARAIFEALDDRRGLAETFDLLALSSVMACDLDKAAACYAQAISLFRELGDRLGLSSALSNYAERGIPAYTEYSYISQAPRAEFFAQAREALEIAREIAWRSGEAYTLFVVGQLHVANGEYEPGLELFGSGLVIAREIKHTQWICAGELGLGIAYQGLLDLAQAEEHLDHALALAREIGSLYFIRECTGLLASILVQKGELAKAEALLRETDGSGVAAMTLALRGCLFAEIRLCLARRNGSRALEILDELEAWEQRSGLAANGPGARLLQGLALIQLNRVGEARPVLQAAAESAKDISTRPIRWQVFCALSRMHRLDGDLEQAEAARVKARSAIAEMAAPLVDPALKAIFLQRAESWVAALAASERN